MTQYLGQVVDMRHTMWVQSVQLEKMTERLAFVWGVSCLWSDCTKNRQKQNCTKNRHTLKVISCRKD